MIKQPINLGVKEDKFRSRIVLCFPKHLIPVTFRDENILSINIRVLVWWYAKFVMAPVGVSDQVETGSVFSICRTLLQVGF